MKHQKILRIIFLLLVITGLGHTIYTAYMLSSSDIHSAPAYVAIYSPGVFYLMSLSLAACWLYQRKQWIPYFIAAYLLGWTSLLGDIFIARENRMILYMTLLLLVYPVSFFVASRLLRRNPQSGNVYMPAILIAIYQYFAVVYMESIQWEYLPAYAIIAYAAFFIPFRKKQNQD